MAHVPDPPACRAQVLEFPPNATETERRLLVTALFHLDYQHFEKTGDENDN